MILSSTVDLRRPDAAEIQALLSAPPRKPWVAPKTAVDGVSFRLTSKIDLAQARGGIAAALSGSVNLNRTTVNRDTLIEVSGEYQRMSAEGAADWSLFHPVQGSVLIDAKARGYLHLGPEQMPDWVLPKDLKKALSDWSITEAEGSTILRLAGRFGVEIALSGQTKANVPGSAAAILRAVLPGIDSLAALGLPFAALCDAPPATKITVTSVLPGGKTAPAPLAVHRITKMETRRLDPDRFALPDGFTDLRQARRGKASGVKDSAGRPDFSAGSTGLTTSDRVVIRREKLGVARARPAGRSTQNGNLVAALPFFPKVEPAPAPLLPECGPTVFSESGAMVLRQSALDAVMTAANLLSNRITGFNAGQVTVDGIRMLRITIDWLAQVRANSSVITGLNIALEALVPELATNLARQLCAKTPPIPLGGAEDPIQLRADIEAALIELAADPNISAINRFDLLIAEHRNALIEEVTNARVAAFTLDFRAKVVSGPYPSADFQLVDVVIVLEDGRLALNRSDFVSALTVRGAAGGRSPGIDLGLSVSSLVLGLGMTRSPGDHFWITAAGVLVVGGLVAPVAATMAIATLIGLGPFGLVLLSMSLTSLAPLTLSAIAGGALLLGAVLYLVWNDATLGIDIDDLTISSLIELGPDADDRALVLRPTTTTVGGAITVSVASDTPSALESFFDPIAEDIVAFFDADFRAMLRDQIRTGLRGALADARILRTPLPAGGAVNVPVLVNGELVPDLSPEGVVTDPQPGLVTALEAARVTGQDRMELNGAAQAGMTFPFPTLRPFATQVGADPGPALDRTIAAIEVADTVPRGVLLAHTVSQNLINGVAHARWLSGRFASDLNDADAAAAFAALGAADARLAGFADGGVRVHAWAAAGPRIQVSQQAFATNPTRPCLLAVFPDIRLCLETEVSGASSAIEFRVAAETVAHLALGKAPGAGSTGFSLLAISGDMLNLRYDVAASAVRLHPPGVQAVTGHDAAADLLDSLGLDGRAALIGAMEDFLMLAARQVIGRDGDGGLVFVTPEGALNTQIADSAFLVETTPQADAVQITIRLLPEIAERLPFTDASGTLQAARNPLS